MKEGSDGHEDHRHPENRSPLREVTVKLLAPRRSSLHSVPQQPIASLLTTSSRVRRRDLRSSDLSPRTALDGLNFSCTASVPALFQRASESLPIKTLQLVTSCLNHVQPHHKPTRATIPKMGRRGGDLANRLDRKFYFAYTLFQQTSGSREKQTGYPPGRRYCRTRSMESKSIIFPSSSPPVDSSPRSRRTKEVARWKWSS